MTLDEDGDLFDEDLDAVGVALNHTRSSASVGRQRTGVCGLTEKPFTWKNR